MKIEPTDQMIMAFGIGWQTEDDQHFIPGPGDRRRAGLRAALAELDLAAVLAGVEDLETVIRAVVREQAIRDTVAETGEERQHVADLLDASISMGQEAVLSLTDGEPTTLARALQSYVADLEGQDDLLARDQVAGELEALLAYPWPGPELEVDRPDDETVIVKVAGELVAGASHDDHGWAGMDLVVTTAQNVHKAVTRANK